MSWLALYKIVFMSELLIAEIMLTIYYPKRKGFAYLCPLAFLLCYGCRLRQTYHFSDMKRMQERQSLKGMH